MFEKDESFGMGRIGVTGSGGLVGSALCALLRGHGYQVAELDLRLPLRSEGRGDVLDVPRVRRLVDGCDGLVHLAAVSRVVWGEQDPWLCVETNVRGTQNILDAALAKKPRPWVILASSREVYGEPSSLPVSEDAPLSPLNVYGCSKFLGERLLGDARRQGLQTLVLRLSNVYGSVLDHPDRVVPAFARAAAMGAELRLDGAEHTFDFTHVDDTARGIIAAIQALSAGEMALPPIHLVTGRATSLLRLAELAMAAGGGRSKMREAPSRTYDVGRFVGDPRRAEQLLGWRASRSIDDGICALVGAFVGQLDFDSEKAIEGSAR